jgi:phage baseplate assembly protein W
MDNRDANFLGTGWQFPPEFTKSNGSVVMTEKEEDIKCSLNVLLSTMPLERVMQPRYGCDLRQWLFESMDTTTLTLIKDKIATSILYYEPRISLKNVLLHTERLLEGILLIELDYVIQATNSRFNIVFPFYLQEGTEVNLNDTNNPVLM